MRAKWEEIKSIRVELCSCSRLLPRCSWRRRWRSPRTRSTRPRRRPFGEAQEQNGSFAGGPQLQRGEPPERYADGDGRFAQFDRLRRSTGEGGGARADVRLPQGMGRGQQQLRYGSPECDDIGARRGRRVCRGRRRGAEGSEVGRRQTHVPGVRPRGRLVEGDGTRFAVHRLVRRARIWRSGFRRRRWLPRWLRRRWVARRLVCSSWRRVGGGRGRRLGCRLRRVQRLQSYLRGLSLSALLLRSNSVRNAEVILQHIYA